MRFNSDLLRKSLALLSMTGILSVGSPAITAAAEVVDPGSIRQVMEAEMAWSDIPGLAVAISVNGQLVFREALGLASLELGTPLTTSSVFQLSSTSKVFTGVAALRMAEAGLLDLDAPAGRYLSEIAKVWPDVTVRQLLTHTSGLPEVLECDTPLRDEALRCVLAMLTPNAPLERFRYNQTNYFLIELILERQGKRPFPDLMKEWVWAPAGMVSTSYAGSNLDVVKGRVSSYYPSPDGPMRQRVYDFPEYLLSAAGANSTLDDLIRFDAAVGSGTLIDNKQLSVLWHEPELSDGQISSYGLGWDLKSHGEGHRSAGHEGGGLTTLRRFFDDGVTVVVLANGHSGRFDPDQLALRVASRAVPGLATPTLALIEQMHEHLTTGDLEGAVESYSMFVAANADAGTEDPLNALGYDLLARRRPDDAVTIFQLNVERYPTSSNAHDSLGEALAAAGDVEGALEAYKESLRLDPSNENAEQMIETLRKRSSDSGPDQETQKLGVRSSGA